MTNLMIKQEEFYDMISEIDDVIETYTKKRISYHSLVEIGDMILEHLEIEMEN